MQKFALPSVLLLPAAALAHGEHPPMPGPTHGVYHGMASAGLAIVALLVVGILLYRAKSRWL